MIPRAIPSPLAPPIAMFEVQYWGGRSPRVASTEARMDVRSSPTDPAIASTLEAVADLAQRRAAERHLAPVTAAAFARVLYAGLAADDLAAAPIADRAAAALTLLEFTRERSLGEAKVRVYDPTTTEHGYGASYSVVEI